MNAILGQIENATVTNGSLPVLGPRLNGSSATFQSSFAVNGSDWDGDMIADSINANGTIGGDAWGIGPPLVTAATLLNARAPAARNIVVDTTPGNATGGGTTALPFINTNLGATEAARLAFLGFGPTPPQIPPPSTARWAIPWTWSIT